MTERYISIAKAHYENYLLVTNQILRETLYSREDYSRKRLHLLSFAGYLAGKSR